MTVKNARKFVKIQHETAILDEVVDAMNRVYGFCYKVIERPDPPDAIISNGTTTSWIELVDVFRTGDEAREQFSFVTPGEIPHLRREKIIENSDGRIINGILTACYSKATYSSYKPVSERYGPGILIVSEQDPLFTEKALVELRSELDESFGLYSFLKDKHLSGECYMNTIILRYRPNGATRHSLVRLYPFWERIC